MVELAYAVFALATAIYTHMYAVVPALSKLAELNISPIPNTLKFRRTTYLVFFCISVIFAPVLFVTLVVLPTADKAFMESLVNSLK